MEKNLIVDLLYVFHGRVTLFFANNSLTNAMSDHHEMFTQFFFNPWSIF